MTHAHTEPSDGPRRPDRPTLEDCQILSPAIREYIVALETYAAALEARAWTVATELHYEADNRNAAVFDDLADELTVGLLAEGSRS